MTGQISEQQINTMLASADQYRLKNELGAAKDVCKAILDAQPLHANTLNYLGLLEFHLGNRTEAVSLIEKAINTDPGVGSYYNNLGNMYYQLQRYAESKLAFERAIELNSFDLMALFNYAWLLGDEGRTEEARHYYGLILQQSPVPGVQVRLAMLVPPIVQSSGEIQKVRQRFKNEVSALVDSGISIQDPFNEIGTTNFYLAYHGENNRELQCLVAKMLCNACPALLFTAPHCRQKPNWHEDQQIRIGFISRFFTDHSIGKTTCGLIEKLDRKRFHVTVFFLDTPSGQAGEAIKNSADEVVIISNDLDHARQRIAESKLHILLYPDIGMESFTYYLAFSRLAHVQCTSFGHPDTTGIPGLDYFISTECYETAESDDHYSETLVRLRGISSLAYYYKPDVPVILKGREYFGLDDKDNIYICPQHLFKVHPEFDSMLAGILRADNCARIIFIEGQHPHWGSMLRNRFRGAMADVDDRIQFVPRQAGADFINLIAVSDVTLDTPYFGGQNTTHESLAAGVPIVTLPGKLHRSRHTMCFLAAIGLDECVASDSGDYVRIAVRLGTDPEYNASVREQIREKAERVWKDDAVVSEHERFFLEALGKLV